MPFWFSSIPILVALPLFALVFATIAVVAHVIFRHFVPPKRLIEQHEVAGFIVSVVGVLYSVVLGFLVGTVWTGFSTAQETTNKEAGYVGDAYNFAGLLRQHPAREDLQRTIARYAIVVRDVEWGSPDRKSVNARELALLNRAVSVVATMPEPSASQGPGTLLASNELRGALLGTLREIGDTRRLRLVQSQDWLPPGMIEALILGAIFVVTFAFFFGMTSFWRQMAMTALLAGSIGLFFGLVIELSTPYTGAIQVSRDAWTDVITANNFEEAAK